MKAVVAAFKQEKALAGAFSVITNPRMDLFEALLLTSTPLLEYQNCYEASSGDSAHSALGTGTANTLTVAGVACHHLARGLRETVNVSRETFGANNISVFGSKIFRVCTVKIFDIFSIH